MSKHSTNTILDYNKDYFVFTSLSDDKKIKLTVREKNVDLTNFRELQEGDTFDRLIVVRDYNPKSGSGKTIYSFFENVTLYKVDSDLQDVHGRLMDYYFVFKHGQNLASKFEFQAWLRGLKIDYLLDE